MFGLNCLKSRSFDPAEERNFVVLSCYVLVILFCGELFVYEEQFYRLIFLPNIVGTEDFSFICKDLLK